MLKTRKKEDPACGIYRNGNLYWLAYQRNKKRVFVSLETDDFALAVTRASEIRGTPELNRGCLLSIMSERFVAYKLKMLEYSRFSAENKKYALRRLTQFVGDVAPEDVSIAQLQSFYEAQRKRVSESTAQGYMMILRSFFQWCVSVERVIRQNPCHGVKMAKVSWASRNRFCEAALRDRLIDNCERLDLKFTLYCGFHAGLRRNEIIEARPEWFDLKRRLIHLIKMPPKEATARGLDPFDLKDREERTIPMTSEFLRFLQEYPLDGDYCIAPGVRRWVGRYRYDFYLPFTNYMEDQKCPWVTIHTMRHTFASLLASEGVSLGFISQWLGDDIRTTTRHYTHFLPRHSEIEKAFRRPEKEELAQAEAPAISGVLVEA